MPGIVNIKATICFTTDVKSQDPSNYTSSGLTVTFRPNKDAVEAYSLVITVSAPRVPDLHNRIAIKYQNQLGFFVSKKRKTITTIYWVSRESITNR